MLFKKQDEDKPRKVPYYPKTRKPRSGTHGSPEDRAGLATFDEVAALVASGKYAGLGLAMFPETEIIGVDLDYCIAPDGSYSSIAQEFLADNTYAEKSPSGTGLHIFYRGTGVHKKNIPAGVESFFGKGYLTFTGDRINGIDILAISPERKARLAELVGKREPGAVAKAKPTAGAADVAALLRRLEGALPYLKEDADDRDDWLKVGWAIGRDTNQSPEGFELWLAWARQSRKHNADALKQMRREYFEGSLQIRDNPVTCATIFHRAMQRGMPLRRPCTDLGNAERLADAVADRLRYCPQADKWLAWDGGRWRFDEDGVAMRAMKRVVRSIYDEVRDETDDDKRRSLAKWAVASESSKGLRAAVDLAKSESPLLVDMNELDADPWLLGVRNGTLDLRTGALREALSEDFITKQALVVFDPGAKCPEWERFLDRIFARDRELIGYVRRALGYTLTGDTMAKALFFMYGPGGDNGKSTLIELLQSLLGDYAVKTRAETFMRSKDSDKNSPDPFRMALRGARLVVAAELSDRQAFDETFLKDATGGVDRIATRGLYANAITTFRPEFKLWLYGNHKPRLREDDDAAWRRLHLIPFEVRIPLAEQDKSLGRKLAAESAGILNWLLVGLAEYRERGLAPPDKVLAAGSKYRNEMDSIGQFIDECCVRAREVSGAALYRRYVEHARDNGERFPLANKRFTQKLVERGIAHRMRDGSRVWVGLALRDPTDPVTEGES